ncbi:MAG TPA: potassium channel family protein [Verrucomicrobiae bacterium]|nr:potassium channel family protein [Verrucomicrobiae bacterium]
MTLFPAVIGFLIVAVVLWEAFETIVLPRRVARRWRITVLFYRVTWFPWRSLAHAIKRTRLRETLLSFYGPLSLLCLFIFWAGALIVGFGLLYRSAAVANAISQSISTCVYLSGTTFFTLGLGDVVPHVGVERLLAVTESGLGFGFLALVLSYLPVIYQAFSRREVNIVLLDARAGSPPTACELLRRHTGPGGVEALDQVLHDWERSAADILESHVSYPAVSYFRSQHNNESWLAAFTAILDATALVLTGVENIASRQARLTFAICRHTVVDLTQVFNLRPHRGDADRLPAGELQRLRTALAQAGVQLRDDEAAVAKLVKLREMYEPYLRALSDFLHMELPPWILAKEITDNWRTSAWGRITGFSSSGPREPDDHAD